MINDPMLQYAVCSLKRKSTCTCFIASKTHSITMTAEAIPMDKENVENRPVPNAGDGMKNTTTSSSQQKHVFSPELLKMYYARLFPYEFMHSWLSYDPLGKQPQLFSRREFSFTIEPFPGEEIYIRYQSFNSEDELKEAIVKRNPRKIDIGAIFSHPPKDKNAVQNFTTSQRELVFDIDLTDYDDVRNCGCSGAAICGRCWEFMTMAVKVMDEGLKEDFGFEKIAWFYSGRRGVHAWICDESARMLSNEARSAVANYFEVREAPESPRHCAYKTNAYI
jgi:DNA primase small subunit